MAPPAKSGPTGPTQAFSSFVQRTGMHAVPSIVSDRSRPSRIGWSVLLMIAACFLLYQIVSICEKVGSYPTATVTAVNYDSPMAFPAVTFCNLNPLRLDQLDLMNKEAAATRVKRSVKWGNRGGFSSPKSRKQRQKEAKNQQRKQGKGRRKEKKIQRKKLRENRKKKKNKNKDKKKNINEIANLVRPPSPGRGKPIDRKKQDTKKLRTDTVLRDRVMLLMNLLPEETLNRLTYNLSDILVDCSFQGRNCDFEKDFVRVMNPRLGACYIFNSGMNAAKAPVPVKTIINSGTDNGLELTLFVDVKDYLPDIAPVTGYKLLVHDQKEPPIPDQTGFMLKPGAFTMLGLRASEIERAEEPYGHCKRFSKADNESMNMYIDSLPLTSPTMTTCMRTCEQSEIIKNCDCFSLLHGYTTSPAFKAYSVDARMNPCNLSDTSLEYNCTRKQLAAVNQKDSVCKTKMCKNNECFSRRFTVSQSIASWPALNSLENIRNTFKNVDILIKNYRQAVDDTSAKASDNFGKNFLKVMVYFEDLNVINIKTYPSYTWVDFLSDLGGQGGLWLGMSAFTIIEVCVLLIEMSRLTVYYFLSKKSGGNTAEEPESQPEDLPLRNKEDDENNEIKV